MTKPELERDVKEYFLKRLKNLEDAAFVFTRKVEWVGRKAAPDWRACVIAKPGVVKSGYRRAFWVELKKPSTPEASAAQAREHRDMKLAGEDPVYVLSSRASVDAFFGPIEQTLGLLA